MSDLLIGMVATQLGIPAEVLAELKATNPRMMGARFGADGQATLTVEVSNPRATFPVNITLPLEQLKRLGPVYKRARELAYAND